MHQAEPSYTIDFGDLASSIWRHRAATLPGQIQNGVIVNSAAIAEPHFANVVLTPQSTWTDDSSDVLSGHERVAAAIVDAWAGDNPIEVSIKVEVWMADNHKQDVLDLNWAKRWRAELAATPAIVAALKQGEEELFDRAELTKFQRMAMRCVAAGKTPKEIAFSVGITPDAARSRIDDARKKILALGDLADVVA